FYPLGLATIRGRLDMVRLLLNHGADVSLRRPKWHTALLTACLGGHASILEELITAGADPNERYTKGRTPLLWLAREGSARIVKTLINAGAQLDARDFDGCAAIHHAAAVGHTSTLHELVVAGSSHAWRSNNFQTPLAVACFSGKWENVKHLLDNCGADPGVIDGLRHTPLQIAAHHGHLAVVKLLLRCDVHELGPNAYPGALCAAAMAGNVSVLGALLVAEGRAHANGTEIGTKMTPLLYSAGNCHPIPTAMLLEAGGD
ncbi:unnamed protein product, partial [Laminaria digitata]